MEPHIRIEPRDAGPPEHDARSLGELFRRLSTDASHLVRSEVALAKAEMSRNVRNVATHAGMVIVGAVMAGVGGLVLVAALVAGLGDLIGDRYWLSALIVGAVFVGAGAFLALRGLKKAKERPLAPEETLSSLRETGDWARQEAAGFRAVLAGDAPPAGGNGNGRALVAERGPAAARAPQRKRAGRGEPDGGGAKKGAQRGTGKEAKSQLPASAPLWKRVKAEFTADDITNQAAKVAYYFFLSLPPLLMALFGLAGFFGGEQTAAELTTRAETSLPPEASALVSGLIEDTVAEKHPGPLSIGLLLALWSGSAVFTSLMDTLNAAYGVEGKRGFVKKKAVAVGTLLAVGVLFLAGSTVLLAGPAIAKALGLGIVWTIAQFPLAFALIVGAFWIIYYVLPEKDQKGCKMVLLKASAVAAGIWLVATFAFRLYVVNFSSYSATYGLLGGIIVLLLWMYVTSLVILLGGEIASEWERSA